MYLLQKKDDSVNYVLKTKEKLHDVIEEVPFKREMHFCHDARMIIHFLYVCKFI